MIVGGGSIINVTDEGGTSDTELVAVTVTSDAFGTEAGAVYDFPSNVPHLSDPHCRVSDTVDDGTPTAVTASCAV